jgi:uncharacterized protein
MMQRTKILILNERISNNLPKRILSLDGGGTKGIVTIAMLEKLEQQLRMLLPQKEKDGFRLNQYFDYIGGTSTGSIIAVLLSLGYSIEKIKDYYFTLGKQIFNNCEKRGFGRYFSKIPTYNHSAIEEYLSSILGDMKLGDKSLLNLLAIFAKNTDSNNIWTFNNNPQSMYYDYPKDNEDHWYPNKEQYLKDLIRASTAAPVYFPPKKLKIKKLSSWEFKFAYFVDGGVSMENNPSFRLFLMSVAPYYNLKWQKGADQLLLISFGTGIYTQTYKKSLKDILINLPGMYINNASQTTDIIMRGLSDHYSSFNIDSELKDVSPGQLNNSPGLSYFRYNFNYRKLKDFYNIDKTEKKAWSEMDNPKNMNELYEIANQGFNFDITEVPPAFKEIYYDWPERFIDGQKTSSK